jgi:ABC-type transport system involved in multi-copper enzyme maturation permease subunit
MTTTSPHTGPLAATSTRPQPGAGAQIWRIARAEWTKLRSVRSTVISFLAMAVVCVGLAAAIAAGTMARWDRLPRAEHLSFEPASRSLAGIFLGQLVIGVLGALVLSAEYSTGTIRATLSASPQRITVLGVKTVVFAAVTFIVAVPTCLAAFWTAQAIYATKHVQTTLGAPGVLRVVIGGALYLTVVGVLGLGLAAILRHTAGAISTLFGLLLVLPILARFLPSDWQANINKYLPSNAGSGIIQLHAEAGNFSPWTGFALFCGYALAALLTGALVLRLRDA